MITRRDLVRTLGRRTVADWILIERTQELGSFDAARGLGRREQRTVFTIVVHHDVPQGRGSARLDITANDGSATEVVDQAVGLASVAVGPAWKSIPPAAPAKVAVLDKTLATGDLVDPASRIARVEAVARVEIMRERVAVLGRSGFHADWVASHVRAEALVTIGERSRDVTRISRLVDKLGLAEGIAGARGDLEQLASAGKPPTGTVDLVLDTEALLHDGALGLWSVFATQGDSVLERQGLSRYRLDSAITPSVRSVEDPITIESNGALDHATRSAPVGEEGDAIRRFWLIERGTCVGVGLSAREAAFRGRDPNGGVRNLVVSNGRWTETPPERATVVLRRLRSVALDPYTGDASLEIGLALEYRGGAPKAFTGGTVRLDLVEALATARRSERRAIRGPYVGPAAVLIRDVELIA